MPRGGHNRIDLSDQVFGRLKVLSLAPSTAKQARWLCLCECGNETVVHGGDLRSGHTQSCGCFKAEGARAQIRHGHSRKGSWSRTYHSWASMLQRCTNPSATGYKNWGGRGIAVCERWLSFENFLADMGERPEGLTLDRRDNEGDYEPSNCRWATYKEQAEKRRKRRTAASQTGPAIHSQLSNETCPGMNTTRPSLSVYGSPC